MQSAVGFNNSNQQGFANFQRSRVGLEQCKGDLEYLIQNNKKLERIVSLTMAKTQNIVNKKQSSHTNELYNKLQNNLYQEILSKYVSITEVEVMKHKYEEKIFSKSTFVSLNSFFLSFRPDSNRHNQPDIQKIF